MATPDRIHPEMHRNKDCFEGIVMKSGMVLLIGICSFDAPRSGELISWSGWFRHLLFLPLGLSNGFLVRVGLEAGRLAGSWDPAYG